MPGRAADAEAGRDHATGQAVEGLAGDGLAHRFGALQRRIEVGVGQQDGELLAADPTDLGSTRHRAAQPVDDLADHRITGRMAEFVIDALEEVDVQHDQRERPAFQQPARTVEDRAAVQRAGQRVMPGLVLELGRETVQLAIELVELALLAVAAPDQAAAFAHQALEMHDQLAQGVATLGRRQGRVVARAQRPLQRRRFLIEQVGRRCGLGHGGHLRRRQHGA
mmetsp:Transcript_15321/g.36558  ORF Transcript_15321/g.36558 Transcript_15321/m.36558 type:complete len:223 (-) Transcript_15321:3216-3884(-)